MTDARLWDRCISHSGREAEEFIADYFGDENRAAVCIGGAGFDPRSTIIAERLSAVMGERLGGLFIREERPNPKHVLIERADANAKRLSELMADKMIVPIEIFLADNAVIGGRTAVREAAEFDVSGMTDIVIDTSALSLGISFPIVRFLWERLQKQPENVNLHLMVLDEPETDQAIEATAGDRVTPIHGFKGLVGLDSKMRAARLWLPLLLKRQRSVLEHIHSDISPDDVCPILPFPASNPRLADELIEYYADEFENTWEVDPRNLVYADEHNPLDLYRTTLRIDDARRRVFSEVGGSLTILTPAGSKVLAIGSLMAAIERDFPVIYVETVAYEVDDAKLDAQRERPGEIVHVWLAGDAYQALEDAEGAVS